MIREPEIIVFGLNMMGIGVALGLIAAIVMVLTRDR